MVILLIWCNKKQQLIAFQDYNNTLISYQEDAVQYIKEYYQSTANIKNSNDLELHYNATRWKIQELHNNTTNSTERNNDPLLKESIRNYLSWLVAAFEKYERPILDRMQTPSEENHAFYHESKTIIQQNALQFSTELARLDKMLDQEYSLFLQKHTTDFSADQLSGLLFE